MSRKKRFDFCILFYNDHYYIPFGNIHTGPKGDLYIGFGKGGEHFSFHSSLQVNYTDPDGVKTILNKRGDSKFYKDTLKNTFEPYQELNVPQRNLMIKLLKHIQPAFSPEGCFNSNCKNKGGLAIKFDELIERTLKFLNTQKETFLQLYGIPDSENQYEEEDDENNSIDTIFPTLNIEKVPECEYCENKEKIRYINEKFQWIKCPQCQGLGYDLEYLTKYKI